MARKALAKKQQVQQQYGGPAHQAWAARHPALAAEERRLRKEQHEIAALCPKTSASTPETRYRAGPVRDGAIARLYLSGALSADQLAWSIEIAMVHAQIIRDVTVRCISLETRVDNGGGGDRAFWEALGAVRREWAYGRWRDDLGEIAGAILAIIVDDCPITLIARQRGMHVRRMRKALSDALDAWPKTMRDACDWIDPAELAAAHTGLI